MDEIFGSVSPDSHNQRQLGRQGSVTFPRPRLDRSLAARGVSVYPQAVTKQLVTNFASVRS
jgi:hypothetical protein